MAMINPYLNFDDTCEAAFNHYKSVFGGEFRMLSRFSDAPKENQGGPEEANKVMHVALPIGKNNILMGSDCPTAYGPLKKGNNMAISYMAESEAETKKIFDGLVEGGTPTMPLAKTFWGSYFGMLTDKFGIQWMVSYDEPK
jgi:PhnB protein